MDLNIVQMAVCPLCTRKIAVVAQEGSPMLMPGLRPPGSRTYPPCCRQWSAAAQEGSVGHQHGRRPFRPKGVGIPLAHRINTCHIELGQSASAHFPYIGFRRLA